MRRSSRADRGARGTVRLVFRPSGWARFAIAAFLGFWLCGWGAGEWVALRLVAGAARGGEKSQLARALTHPVCWMVAGFVLVWLVYWIEPPDTLPLRWKQAEEPGVVVCIERRAFDGAGCFVFLGILFASSVAFAIAFAPDVPLRGSVGVSREGAR